VNICAIFFSPTSQPATLAGLAAVLGLCFFFWGFRLFARRLALSQARGSTVQNASPGLVAISGTATGPHTLKAPVSGRSCYLSQTTVWQHNGRSKSGPWQLVAEETLHVPFFIEDSTGRLLIEPLGAELDLPEAFGAGYGTNISFPLRNDVSPRVSVFLARHGVAVAFPTRIEERIVAPATLVFITGTLRENPGIRPRPFSPQIDGLQSDDSISTAAIAGSAKSTAAPEIIRLSNGPGPASATEMTPQGKIAAALARAGITKPETWTGTGLSSTEAPLGASAQSPSNGGASRSIPAQSATLEVPAQPASVSALVASGVAFGDDREVESVDSSPDPVPPLILMKGEDDPTFVISCHGQRELEGSLGWGSVGLVVGGAALVTFGLCVLLLHWHFR